jgi:hypothetical protein
MLTTFKINKTAERYKIQSLVCCRLHHPGAAAASATILIDYTRFCDRFSCLLLADLPEFTTFWAAR